VRLTALAAAAGALALAGCSDTGPPATTTAAQPPGRPDAAAKAVAQRYLDGYSSKRPADVCSALAAPARQQLAATSGGSCERAIRTSQKGQTFPTLDVGLATARGNTAAATVVGQARIVTLTKEGGRWKVSNGGA
jgi:hypothetical protein